MNGHENKKQFWAHLRLDFAAKIRGILISSKNLVQISWGNLKSNHIHTKKNLDYIMFRYVDDQGLNLATS